MTSYSWAHKAEAPASMGQQPNFAGGMNNPMQGQAPNMGVPNMGSPPAPMPYSPYQPQPMFGMPPYNPYPQQPASSQTSYNPAYSPMGQQPGMGGQQALSIAQQLSGMGGMSAFTQNPQLLQNPQFQGLFGGQQAPQVMPQRMNEMSPAERAYMERDARDQADRARVGEERYRAYQQMTPEQREQREQEYRQRQMADLPPNLQALLNNTRSIPQVMPQQGMGGQQPTGGLGQASSTPQFTTYSVGPMGLPVTIDQSTMGSAPKPGMPQTAGAPTMGFDDAPPTGQSPFAVNTTGTPISKPSTPNIAPKPALTPQQIARQNMMSLQQSLLEAGSRGPAGLQGFLDQLPKTGLTPQQVRAQQQAQMQLRNQQRLRNPSLASDPFTYTPRPAAPVRPAPTPQVNQVTRRMNPDGTFSIA